MSDTNERSVGSRGSHGEPVAWGVFYPDGKLHSSWDSHAKAECTAVTMRKFDHLGVYVSPLYRSPTLTDAEREAIREACDEGRWYLKDYSHIDTLRGLLERMK